MKRYADNPLQVRVERLQEQTMDRIMGDPQYCYDHGIYSKSDIVRRSLNNVCSHYEETTGQNTRK